MRVWNLSPKSSYDIYYINTERFNSVVFLFALLSWYAKKIITTNRLKLKTILIEIWKNKI